MMNLDILRTSCNISIKIQSLLPPVNRGTGTLLILIPFIQSMYNTIL